MKLRLIIPLIVISLAILSFTEQKSNCPNANSWSIAIGEKKLLASSQHHEMGDTITIKRITLNGADSLVASLYLCGQTAEGLLTGLTLKNSSGDIVSESTGQPNNGLMFIASMGVSEIKDSPKIKSGEVAGVYFTVKDYVENEDYTVLLCNLKLE